ncbi:MAG: hypothetical protein Q9209_006362 [Squamulea sp. 1 TL-2023]
MAPKQKGQKMDLGTFLTDTCMPLKPPPARAGLAQWILTFAVALGSWADEMEDMPMPCNTVDDTLKVETNILKALVRITAPATDLLAQHRDMAAVELVETIN